MSKSLGHNGYYGPHGRSNTEQHRMDETDHSVPIARIALAQD